MSSIALDMHAKTGKPVHVEFSDEHAETILITEFDYNSLDSLESIAREMVADGKPLLPLLEDSAMQILERGEARVVRRVVPRVFALAGQEVLARVVALLIDSQAPKFQIAALAHAIGSTVLRGETVPVTAKRFGKSKQAMFQEISRIERELGFPVRQSWNRTEKSKDKMRMANYRHKG